MDVDGGGEAPDRTGTADAADVAALVAAPNVHELVCQLEPFLGGADDGLRGGLASYLRAPEVLRLSRGGSKVKEALADPTVGVTCPHLCPRSGAAFAAALTGCDAPQVRSLRPTDDFDSSDFLPALVARLGGLARLEELGPLAIDASGPPLSVPCKGLVDSAQSRAAADRASSGRSDGESSQDGEASAIFCAVSARKLLPALADGFERCRSLVTLDLTVRCVENSSARTVAEAFLPALGACQSLRTLRLDLDASMKCGSKLMDSLARLLERLSGWRNLEQLSLGYLWWTEASDEALRRLRSALCAFSGCIRKIAIRYPNDQEFGALDAAAGFAIEGAAEGVEEVCVLEGWGHDGMGLSALRDSLATCPRLQRVDLLGVLPTGFDADAYAASVRLANLAARGRRPPPPGDGTEEAGGLPPAAVHFNTPQGWQRAWAASPSAVEKQRLRGAAEDEGPEAAPEAS